MDNKLEIWEKVRNVPATAKKNIGGGRLKGMTDINPMWRIKKLTEIYGPCGIGWYYDILDKHIEDGANGEKAAFVDIKLYVNTGESGWSKGISGTGGSSFVAKEKGGLYVNDECYKMALTDAISVSCKALGFGADVYWAKDNTKYNDNKKSNYKPNETKSPPKKDPLLKKEPLDPLKVTTLENTIKEARVNIEQVLKRYGVTELKELTLYDFTNAMNSLGITIEKAKAKKKNEDIGLLYQGNTDHVAGA